MRIESETEIDKLTQDRRAKEERKEKDLSKQTQNNEQNDKRNKYMIIPLNVIRENIPPKRHTQTEWIQKQDLYICCLQEIHFRH